MSVNYLITTYLADLLVLILTSGVLVLFSTWMLIRSLD